MDLAEDGEAAADSAAADSAAADSAAGDGAAADGATTAKKRTRRGSRGGRRRKKTTAVDASANGGAADDALDEELAEAEEPTSLESDNGAVEEQVAEQPKPAGSSRKRKPRIHVPVDPETAPPSPEVIQEAVADEGDGDEPGSAVEEPAIEIPESGDDGDAAPAVKKKTRRGSRGGRNRRKKATAGATPAGGEAESDPEGGVVTAVAVPVEDDAPVEDDVPTVDDAPVDDDLAAHDVPSARDSSGEGAESEADAGDTPEESDPGYVPMSEWLDDFDRR